MSAPEPLTPLDCDLRSMPSMLLDVVRLRDSNLAQETNAEAFRCGVLSWAASWHQIPAASLPDDDKQLAYLLGYGRDVKSFQKIRAQGGMRGWIKCSDGRLYHPVVAEKALEAMKSKAAQRQRTEAARLAREAERARKEARLSIQPIDITNSAVSVTECATQSVTSSNIRKGKVREGKVIEEKKDNLSLSSQRSVANAPGSDPFGGSLFSNPLTKKKSSPDEFDRFWIAYPRKFGKGHARTAWKAATQKVSPDAIIAAVKAFRWRNNEFDPYPATWLNGERWNDETPESLTPLQRTRRAMGLSDQEPDPSQVDQPQGIFA